MIVCFFLQQQQQNNHHQHGMDEMGFCPELLVGIL